MQRIKITFILFIYLTTQSCTVTQSPLMGKYQESAYIVYSDKSYDWVWSKVIDLFAQKGIMINVIDKSSGIIVSADYPLFGKYTFETAMKAEDPNAWAVLDFWGTMASKPIHPTSIKANFSIRIKEEGAKTSINVNLTNIVAYHQSGAYPHFYNAKSTGVFERELSEQIK